MHSFISPILFVYIVNYSLESRLFDFTINFLIIILFYITHVHSTTTIAPSTTETTIMSHGMILSPKIYNVYDQYRVYMNIPLTPPPPLGIPVVGTVVAVVEVDGTKMDCVIDKSERHWCDLFHYMLHEHITYHL